MNFRNSLCLRNSSKQLFRKLSLYTRMRKVFRKTLSNPFGTENRFGEIDLLRIDSGASEFDVASPAVGLN